MKKFLPFLFMVLVFGCQKELFFEEPPPSPSILGTWKFVSFRDAANYLTNDVPCAADNTLTFKPDSTAILSYGPCRDVGFPLEQALGKWSLSKDGTLSLDGRQRKIFVLNDTALWFGETSGDKIYEFRWKK